MSERETSLASPVKSALRKAFDFFLEREVPVK
jgi:hypothetical protein